MASVLLRANCTKSALQAEGERDYWRLLMSGSRRVCSVAVFALLVAACSRGAVAAPATAAPPAAMTPATPPLATPTMAPTPTPVPTVESAYAAQFHSAIDAPNTARTNALTALAAAGNGVGGWSEPLKNLNAADAAFLAALDGRAWGAAATQAAALATDLKAEKALLVQLLKVPAGHDYTTPAFDNLSHQVPEAIFTSNGAVNDLRTAVGLSKLDLPWPEM
jgi:hypothetical protein